MWVPQVPFPAKDGDDRLSMYFLSSISASLSFEVITWMQSQIQRFPDQNLPLRPTLGQVYPIFYQNPPYANVRDAHNNQYILVVSSFKCRELGPCEPALDNSQCAPSIALQSVCMYSVKVCQDHCLQQPVACSGRRPVTAIRGSNVLEYIIGRVLASWQNSRRPTMLLGYRRPI